MEELEYWKTRCKLAEACLEASPDDPDVTSEQIEAWSRYNTFIESESFERSGFKES